MNESTNKGAVGIVWKIVVYAFWFFFILGLLGSTFMILRMSSGEPPRPDLELDELVGELDKKATIRVMRKKNLIYDKNHQWGDEEPVYFMEQLEDMLVSMAIAQLHDKGKLSVTDDVSKYVSELEGVELKIESLLTHTSGFDAQLKELPEPLPNLQPGTQSVYAPINYVLLKKILEAVTRVSTPQYIQGHVLGPLEITGITWDSEHQGWLATPAELLRFEEYLNSNRVIGLKTHLKAFTASRLANGERGAYCYGWNVRDYNGLRLERVVSRSDQFNGIVMRFPEKEFAAVVLYQGPASEFDSVVIGEKLSKIYLGREMPFNRD